MSAIFDIPITHLKHYHYKYLIKTFGNKDKTPSRVKELQSSIIFFTAFTESEEKGLQWRRTHAKNVNISIIIGVLKHLSKVLDIPMHRICKTSYPVNVYISHYYNELKPYLDTMQFTNVPKNFELPTVEDPFNSAENYVKVNGFSRDTVQFASLVLAASIAKKNGVKIEHVVFYRNLRDEPVFIAFKKENGKLVPIVNEAAKKYVEFPACEITTLSSPTPTERVKLPGIETFLMNIGNSNDYPLCFNQDFSGCLSIPV